MFIDCSPAIKLSKFPRYLVTLAVCIRRTVKGWRVLAYAPLFASKNGQPIFFVVIVASTSLLNTCALIPIVRCPSGDRRDSNRRADDAPQRSPTRYLRRLKCKLLGDIAFLKESCDAAFEAHDYGLAAQLLNHLRSARALLRSALGRQADAVSTATGGISVTSPGARSSRTTGPFE